MKNSIKTFSLITLTAVSLVVVGCDESEIASPVTESPTSQIPDRPDITDPAHPDTANTPVGQTPNHPAGPAIPGAIRKINWAPLDFKTFEYNTAGELLKYTRQYNSVQGTGIVQREEISYMHDDRGRITGFTNKHGFRTVYTYKGDVWSEAMSFDKLDRPLRKYEFQFNSGKQLVAYEEFNAGPDGTLSPRSKSSFSYDAAGNLIRYVNFWYQESTNSFIRSVDLHYSGFDNKKYPRNADSFNEVLQPLSFFVNNPGRKEFVGSATPVEHYSYTYDATGYPKSKQTSYSAEKPIAPLQAAFEY